MLQDPPFPLGSLQQFPVSFELRNPALGSVLQMEPLQGRVQERSTSPIPLATLFVTHLRALLAFLVTEAHGWLMVNC